MRHNTERIGVKPVELIYFALGVILLLLFAIVANGQTVHSQDLQPLYNGYRGVRLGMTVEEARAKLDVPAMLRGLWQ